MTIPNAEHLFEQAERLSGANGPGAPRQVDLRRAVSSAYYGVFRGLLTLATDGFIGKAKRGSPEYALAYRSVDHRWLRDLCAEVQKLTLTAKYRAYEPVGGFGPNIKVFATSVLELQESRHEADYNPLLHLKRSDAVIAIATARSALNGLHGASATERSVFLALLLFRPR